MTDRRLPVHVFLTKSQSWIQPRPNETYKQITARLWGRGLKLRAEVTGASISASRQLRARAGQFLISRIDARHGAFGLVPKELDGALVSNDFPCFQVDTDVVLPQYLEWYSRTGEFIELCRRASEGSTNRVRLKEEKFLKMEVLLPSLSDQQRIVSRLDKVKGLLEKRQQAVATVEREAQALLLKACEHAIDGAAYRPMAEIAPLVRRPVEVKPDLSYPELGVRSFGRGTFHKRSLEGMEVGSKKLFRICDGDLIFNIVFAWEGAVAVVQPEDNGRVGSHRFLTCVPEPEVATAEFLRFYFLTSEGIEKLGEASPGGAGRNRTLGLKKLEAIKVPVPHIARQRWFDRLQQRIREIQQTRRETAAEQDELLPALLHQIFSN